MVRPKKVFTPGSQPPKTRGRPQKKAKTGEKTRGKYTTYKDDSLEAALREIKVIF